MSVPHLQLPSLAVAYFPAHHNSHSPRLRLRLPCCPPHSNTPWATIWLLRYVPPLPALMSTVSIKILRHTSKSQKIKLNLVVSRKFLVILCPPSYSKWIGNSIYVCAWGWIWSDVRRRYFEQQYKLFTVNDNICSDSLFLSCFWVIVITFHFVHTFFAFV